LCLGGEATATPIYAIRSASTCDTCHIEPLGWKDPEKSTRLCTLDCNGCHVSLAGGGMRTPTGRFYGREAMPMWGTRPSEFGDPDRHRIKGYPDQGLYNLFDGFSGWWPGKVDMKTILDRFGDEDPDPTFAVGADARLALYAPLGESLVDKALVFPMQGNVHLFGRAAENVSVYASGGLRGSRSKSEDIPVSEYFTLQEVFAKVDRLPYNTQIRAGRYSPSFGWRVADHTSFIRRGLGFDQNRQVFGVDASYNPNYLIVQGGVFYQGLEAWEPLGEVNDPGVGASGIVGWRDLGWHLFGNLHYLNREEGYDDAAFGASWGLNLGPLVYLGELDFQRRSGADAGLDDANGLFAYHEANWEILRGLSALLKYDWQDGNLDLKDDELHRVTVGAQWWPYTYVSLDAQYRLSFVGPFGGDALQLQDVLVFTHVSY
jgi:hypothetical protein